MLRRDCLQMEITDRWELKDIFTKAEETENRFCNNVDYAALKVKRVHKMTDRCGITFGMKRW